jgi:hypothetical protein
LDLEWFPSEPMNTYHHPLVRDLAWLIVSPLLMAPGTPGLPLPPEEALQRSAAEAEPWLAELDRRPEELEQWLLRHRSPRLGHHAEALMEFWLRRAPGVRFLGARIPVAEGTRTLGDLDLLFHDERRGRRVHWEMAVKFYLQATPSPAWDAWIGPDPRDHLAQKLARVIDHQLPLGRHPLATHGASAPVVSEAFLKGWLFYPPGRAAPPPAGAAPLHGQGWWLRHGSADIPTSARASRFLVLPRLAWMPPARQARGGPPPLAAGELRQRLDEHFRHGHQAQLIAEVQPDREGWWAEVARGFVVAAAWPDTARPT